MQSNNLYNAAIYVRLSKEDEDAAELHKRESNSISNQKMLILDYLQDKPDINIVSVRVDDGYTGTNYDRPAFQLMMDDIKAGRVNCVVVKDLSRFGREYINAGKYIDRLFPYYGVRLIAINDNVDTITRNASDDFSIMVKNLMNDNYCRDISIKIRSQFQVKRKNGEYIGSFAPYGYQKAEDDHNKLVVDPYAASIVQDIFKWKIDGLSLSAIANRLSEQGVLPPTEYKRSQGLKFKSGYQRNPRVKWNPVTVRRILTNPVYIGTLIQGVRTRPNYKIKTVVANDPENWTVLENAIEPIISDKMFRMVQRLLKMDTRTAPTEELVFPLAGVLVCGDCGSAMVRRSTVSKGKKYVYYTCSASKDKKACSGHLIPEGQLTDTVLSLLQQHVTLVTELEGCLQAIKDAPMLKISQKKLQERLAKIDEEENHYRKLKVSLYQDFQEDVIPKEDFLDIRRQYDARITDALIARDQLQREMEMTMNADTEICGWMQGFIDKRNLQELTRSVVVECIEEVAVFEDKRLKVTFTHAQDYDLLTQHVNDFCEEVV